MGPEAPSPGEPRARVSSPTTPAGRRCPTCKSTPTPDLTASGCMPRRRDWRPAPPFRSPALWEQPPRFPPPASSGSLPGWPPPAGWRSRLCRRGKATTPAHRSRPLRRPDRLPAVAERFSARLTRHVAQALMPVSMGPPARTAQGRQESLLCLSWRSSWVSVFLAHLAYLARHVFFHCGTAERELTQRVLESTAYRASSVAG